MEEMKKDMGMPMNHGSSCSCGSCGIMGRGMCGMCGGRRFWALRWLLALVILAMVFGLGVKVGEFKAYFEGSFGGGYGSYGHMSRYNMMVGGQEGMYPVRMMTQQAVPDTSVTPAK